MESSWKPLSALFLAGVCLLIAVTSVLCEEYILPSEVDLCSTRQRVGLNGEHLSSPGDSLIAYVNRTIEDSKVALHCRMRFSSCNHCRLRVTAAVDFYYSRCPPHQNYKEYNNWCVPGCSYIHLYDRDYTNQTAVSYTSSTEFFHPVDFRTESSVLYVIVCSNRSFNHRVSFRLNISAEEKKQTLKGYLDQPEVFSSPFFPEEYLLNSEIYTYAFEADDQNQFITISFDDWQLSKYSTIQFDKANIKGLITGSNSRPWIISDNHKLTMTFNTGPVRIPGLYKAQGFRATYTVHNGDRDLLPFVHTNCGWGINHFHDDSGIITFNPTGNGIDYYDCIWIIKKHPGFHGVMVQILSYISQDMTYRRNHPNVLEIRRGSTSLGELVELAYPSTRPNLYFSHHSSVDGFYVRLKGHYYGKKDFILSYTSFNIANQCGGLFRCDNQRCIPRDLTCNEIDNCGDRSDEIYFNCESTSRPGGSPNSGTSPLNVSIIIPLVVSIFLIVVICLLIIFIRRCRRLSMEAHRAHRRRQCISTVSGSSSSTGRQHRRHRRRDDRNGETVYDPPPSYADVLNNTPIGYLNLGFADASYSATAPVAPPSYEEAISSPGGSNATFNFQGNAPHEDSSDSSSPLSGGHSQTNLSTSYSSDDTHLSRNRHLRHRATSLSSSDSSTDGVCMPSGESTERQADENGCRSSSSQVDREEIHPTQTALTDNSWHGIAKPEDASIEMPDSSTVDIAGHNKNSSKTSNKSTNAMQGENESQDSPAVIRLPSGSSDVLSSPDPESGERRIAPSTTSRARVEQSPLILAPTLLSLASSLDRNDGGGTSLSAAAGVLTGTRSSLQRPDVTESNLQSHHGSCAVLGEDTSSSDAAACENQSPSRRDRQSRPSPTRNVPAHIRKAKGSSLMKHMSRSMDDISRHTELGYTDRRPGGGEPGSGMPSRQFSKSVQNIAEMPPPLRQGQRADSGDGLLYMDRGPRHHQSQPLLSPPPQASRHLDTRPIPRERSNNSHHHGDARRQGSLEEQHHEAGDRNQSRARPSVGVDRNLDRPKMHHEQTRGQSHHSGAQDNGKYGRSRMDLQVMQRRPEAPLHRQPRSQSQPQPKHRRLGPAPGERSGQLRPDIPGSEQRSQTQAGSCHPPYSRGDRTTTNPDLQRRPQSGVMEETARRPDHSTIHPNHNAKSSHTSQGQQHPPYSHSLDRQGARPGYGSDSSFPHPTRNTLSLDRNGQRPQTEHQKLGHSTDMKNQSRANLPQTSSARPPLLPKPDGASSRPPYSGRNHQNSDSSLCSEQDPDKNRVLYTSSDRLPPYRPPSHSTQAPRSQADLHMVPADKTRPSSRPSGSHHSESNMYPEQNRQWSQPRDFRDSGPDSQARHTAMGVHQTQDQPPRPARASRLSSNTSQGSLPETERPNYITEHNPSAVSGVHGDAGALHKSSSSAPSFLSSNTNSPINSNLDSFTGTPDSLHSSTTGPTTIATSTGTTTANTTYTAASASLPDNRNQRPPHIHGAAGSSEYTSYQSQPLDQGRKEGSDLILNRNAETGRNAARTPTKSAVAVSPSHILQDSRGTGTGSQPVLYLQLGDGEGEFEENDIYV